MTHKETARKAVGRRTLLRGGAAVLATSTGYGLFGGGTAQASAVEVGQLDRVSGRVRFPFTAVYEPTTTQMAARPLQNVLEANTITPLDFGAVGDGVTDDTVPLQAAFEYWLGTEEVVTLDLAGRSYLVSAGLKVPPVNFGTKRMTNGSLTASPTFAPGDYMLDFETGLAAKLFGLTLDHLELIGGPWHDPAYATGGILLGRTQGVSIVHNNVRAFSDACIKCTDGHAATEIRVAYNVISGQNGGNPNVRGVELTGYDSDIESNIIRGCDVAIYLHRGANTVTKNHLYAFGTPAQYGIICASNAGNLLINDNSIDNLTVRLVAPGGGIRISGNQFKVKASMPGAPVSIEFAPQDADAVLADVAITGNTFWAPNGRFDVIRVDESNGSFDPNAVSRCSVRHNTFEHTVERTTHPARAVSFANAAEGVADFGPSSAGVLPAFGDVRRVIAMTQEISSGPGAAVWHAAPSANQVSVKTAGAITGTVTVTGSVNTDDV